MNTKRLGNSDVYVSEQIFGAWAIGGTYFLGAEDQTSIETIRTGIEHSVTTIDTAYIYGNGHSEQVVGEAIQGYDREKLTVISKLWYNWMRQDRVEIGADNSLKALPMEDGKMEKHKNKFGKLASIVSTAATAAGALGGIGMIAGAGSSSLGAVVTGAQVMGTAANVGSLADAANTLAGAEGMDFTFDGPSSALKCKNDGKDVRVLVNLRATKREDGLALFKVIRFNKSKKDRRLQWFQTKAALINTDDSEKADKAGYLSFGYQNYGDHSSILTIPAAQLISGEYAVLFLGNMITPTLSSICYSFSVE